VKSVDEVGEVKGALARGYSGLRRGGSGGGRRLGHALEDALHQAEAERAPGLGLLEQAVKEAAVGSGARER
jgi:hypothetical protein